MFPFWTSLLGHFQLPRTGMIQLNLNKRNRPETYRQFCLQLITEYPSSENKKQNKKLTGGSKPEEGVAGAAVSTKDIRKPFTCGLQDDSSIFAAELRAIHIYCSKEKSFLILSDSLWSLQSIFNLMHLSTNLRTTNGFDQRWEGGCFYLGPRPCGH